jgi:hypothetical protein
MIEQNLRVAERDACMPLYSGFHCLTAWRDDLGRGWEGWAAPIP